MTRRTVAVDLDGVVVKWFCHFYQVAEEMFGPLKVPYQLVSDPDFTKALGLTREQAIAAVEETGRRYPVETLGFKPGAREALEQIGRQFDLTVVTSRRDSLRDGTLEWVRRNLWGVPVFWSHAQGLEVFGSPNRPRKVEIVQALNAICLIEDTSHELEPWPAECSVLPVCCARPWNRSLAVSRPDILRLNWPQIVELLLAPDPA